MSAQPGCPQHPPAPAPLPCLSCQKYAPVAHLFQTLHSPSKCQALCEGAVRYPFYSPAPKGIWDPIAQALCPPRSKRLAHLPAQSPGQAGQCQPAHAKHQDSITQGCCQGGPGVWGGTHMIPWGAKALGVREFLKITPV